MTTVYLFLTLLAILAFANLLFTLKAGKNSDGNNLFEIKSSLTVLSQYMQNAERNLKEEFVTNRKENTDNAKGLREEVTNQLDSFTKTFAGQLKTLTDSIEAKFTTFNTTIETNDKASRKELKETFDAFKLEVNNSLKDFGDRQRDNFGDLQKNLNTQNVAAATKLDSIRDTVEKKIGELQKGNEAKLEEMRKTVDEKLNETLEKRLGESFKLVSERLEAVHKGLGDMQNLAKDVGNLNKTMNNVKSRGILGEYQLHNLLEDLLTNEQYEQNVKTKAGSGAVVEFAVKMPNGSNVEKTLWLPIDSKFPKEDYEALVDAYEQGDTDKIEEYRKAFVRGIRKNAQDIREKYIDPPNTTEYGVMFLPYESLYAEVLRTPGLFDQLQKDYKITIAGPTTLSAFLNSLQMGFRTLAIEKRSGEVWDLLGAVKTEFGKFGGIIEKTRDKLIQATKELDNTGVRSRAIERKLRNVQELSGTEAGKLLDPSADNLSEDQNEPAGYQG